MSVDCARIVDRDENGIYGMRFSSQATNQRHRQYPIPLLAGFASLTAPPDRFSEP